MPLRQRIPASTLGFSPDQLADSIQSVALRWKIHPALVCKLYTMAGRLPFAVFIISGFRTCEHQERLREEGRPTAPCALSTHVATCPATGVDVSVSVTPVVAVRQTLGAEAVFAGLRWGGGGPVDSDGQPLDWNHLDLGPVMAG